jgi:hypothetical protein
LKYFYDCEFLEDGRVIDLISIGIVAEDGREYYAVNLDAPWRRIREHAWLMDNVVPHLPQPHGDWRNHMPKTWLFDRDHPDVKIPATIAREVEAFIAAGGADRADNELWAYYGAYDHVALCQLWGPMVSLPGCVPMWTHDLMQAVDTRDLRGVNLASFVPQQAEHHALADARWNRDVYNWIKENA